MCDRDEGEEERESYQSCCQSPGPGCDKKGSAAAIAIYLSCSVSPSHTHI